MIDVREAQHGRPFPFTLWSLALAVAQGFPEDPSVQVDFDGWGAPVEILLESPRCAGFSRKLGRVVDGECTVVKLERA